MAPTVIIPEELKAASRAFRESFVAQLDSQAKSAATVEAEIQKLSGIERELVARAEALQRQAASSDEASGQLVQTQTRLSALRQQISGLHEEANHQPQLTLAEAGPILSEICAHYREKLPKLIAEAMAPFEIPSHLLRPLMAHCFVIRALELAQNREVWHPATPSLIDSILSILKRAEKGQLNLWADSKPAQSEDNHAAS